MAQANVQVVRAIYEHFAATHKIDLERLAPDVVWDMSNFETWPEQPVYEGHEGVDAFVSRWLEPWETYDHDLEQLLDSGDVVLGIVRVSGTATASGASVEMRVGHVWTLVDGTVTRVTLYDDPAKALQAAGLD